MSTAIIIPCDRNYLEGLKVLLYSLEYNTPTPVHVVVISEDITSEDIGTGIARIHRPDVSKYADIPREGRFPNVVYHTWDALNLGYDRLIFIGADQLIVSDISPLLSEDLPPLCMVKENTKGEWTGNYCTGMLTIEPAHFPGLWETWMDLATQGESYDSGDQGVINKWIKMNKIDVTPLDQYWDVSRRRFETAGWWNKHKHQFRSIHYVGSVKPWMKTIATVDDLDILWHTYKDQEPMIVPDQVLG